MALRRTVSDIQRNPSKPLTESSYTPDGSVNWSKPETYPKFKELNIFLTPPILLLPSSGSAKLDTSDSDKRNSMFMYEFTHLPVEIWHQILYAVIDVPFILDTSVDPKICYWGRRHLYDDKQVYMDSERQRGLLRLVCQSWRAFADKQKYRWIFYDPSTDPMSTRHNEALQALEAIGPAVHSNCAIENESMTVWPKRLDIFIRSQGHLQPSQSLFSHGSQNLTKLCVEASTEYRDGVFSTLINHSSDLPCLRDLTLPQPNDHGGPLQALSKAFPQLTALKMSHRDSFLLHPDHIKLQHLESLSLDLLGHENFQVEDSEMPALLRLNILVRVLESTSEFHSKLLHLNGSRLVFLQLGRSLVWRLPIGFWEWCPALMEFAASFSKLDIGSPVPTGHPLKQVVHFPDPHFIDVDVTDNNILWRNMELLPHGLECFIFSERGGWVGYAARLDSTYRPNVAERYLRRLSQACAGRSVHVQDENNVALDKVLEEYSWETGLE